MNANRLLYPKNKIDWGPGENHICLRTPSKNYYVIELFHQSPTFDKLIPLFISDINSSPNLYGIYNYIADHLRHVVMVNNHPINKLSIFGKIIQEQYKDKLYEGGEKASVILVVSDSIGYDCKIRVKLTQEQFTAAGLMLDQNNYGKIIEMEGTICSWCDQHDHNKKPDREINVAKIKILSHRPDDLHFEMDQWQKRMEFRRNNLECPWIFIPTPQRKLQAIEYEIPIDELKRKKQQKELDLTSSKESDSIPRQEDSLLVHALHKSGLANHDISNPSLKKVALKNSRHNTSLSTESNTVVCLEPPQDIPVKALTELELTREIIKFLIKKKFTTVKLCDIYQDQHISELLYHLTKLQMASLQTIPKFQNLSFEEFKSIIFHRLRYNLQKKLQLITVSKSQRVRLDNLKNLYLSLLKILKTFKEINIPKPFRVMDYLDMLKSRKLLLGDVNYKLMNFIIELILEEDLDDTSNWQCETRTASWTYIAPS